MGEMSEIKAMVESFVKGKEANVEMDQQDGGETHYSETHTEGRGSCKGERVEDSEEVRQLLKPVELPSFHGNDPVG